MRDQRKVVASVEVPRIEELGTTHRYLWQVKEDDPALTQLVPVSVTKGSDNQRDGELVVVPTAFLDGPQTMMQSYRNALIAYHAGVDVISVGVPGMAVGDLDDITSSERRIYTLTPQQHVALRTGDFTSVGAAMWDAVREIAEPEGIDLTERQIHFLDYSLGNSTMAGMLAGATEFANKPGRIIKVEGAAYFPRTKRTLLKAFTSKVEQKANEAYEASNPEYVPTTTDLRSLAKLAKNVIAHPSVHYSVGSGLAAGKDTDQLLKALKGHDVPADDVRVSYVNGSSSAVSPTEQNEQAAATVRSAVGSRSEVRHTVWESEYHGFCNDLGRFIFEATRLLS